MNRKLSFRDHVRIKTEATICARDDLNRLVNIKPGLSPLAVRQLYNACIVPVNDFKAEV